jgi:PAS domain-containing protein
MATKTEIDRELQNFLPAGKEARLSAYFALVEHAAHIGSWRYDLRDQSHFWSPGMYRLMGVDPDIQQPDNAWLRRQLPPEDQARMTETIAEAIRTRSPFFHRAHHVSLGPLLPGVRDQVIDTHGEVGIDPSGRVVALIGVCQNVTQRVRDEEARALVREQ